MLGRWWARYSADDLAGLTPHSRRPHASPTRLAARVEQRILATARRSASVPCGLPTRWRSATARCSGCSSATGKISCRGRPASKPRRYEKQRPGELLHIDLKYLPALRNARNDFEFAAVDDFSREAVVSIRTDATSATAAAFLEHVAATLPYAIEAVLTDNAFAFTMRHAHIRSADPISTGVRRARIRHYLLRLTRRNRTAKSNASFARSTTSASTSDRCSRLPRAAEPWNASSGITTMNDRISVWAG